MADPFEEFDFKPLTEGLGFHKKAETLKSEIQSTLASSNASVSRSSIFPESPKPSAPVNRSSDRAPDRAATKSFGFTSSESSRTASQSISELMASLPPSLDFLDDKQDLTRKSAMRNSDRAGLRADMTFGQATPVTPSTRPQIFQPLGQSVTQAANQVGQGPTVGSVLPAPGTKAGSKVPTFAAMAAPLVTATSGQMTAPRAGYSGRMTETFGKAFPTSESARSEKRTEKETDKRTNKQIAQAEGLVPVAASFSASLIDAMVVAGIATILLVCIITITHINLVAMLSNASTDGVTQKNLVFLFFAVLQMYMLISRAFFGATLGEWAFELQLGTREQSRKLYYPVLVMWRMTVIALTGIFAIPLLSFAFGRDLAKYVTGLQLYRHT